MFASTVDFRLSLDFFDSGLYTRTAVARLTLALAKLSFLVTLRRHGMRQAYTDTVPDGGHEIRFFIQPFRSLDRDCLTSKVHHCCVRPTNH